MWRNGPAHFTAFTVYCRQQTRTGLGLRADPTYYWTALRQNHRRKHQPTGCMRFILPRKPSGTEKCESTIMPSELIRRHCTNSYPQKQTQRCISKITHIPSAKEYIMSTQTPIPATFQLNHIILIGASERPYSLANAYSATRWVRPFAENTTSQPAPHTIAGFLPVNQPRNKILQCRLIIAVTLPDSYDTLFKTCCKK